MPNLRPALLATALAAAALATPASATPLRFSFTGALSGGFTVDSNPTPNYLDATSFGTLLTATTGDFAGAGGAQFYLPTGGGGLALYAGPSASTFVAAAGPQLFTGALTSPTFAAGSFRLTVPGGATTRLAITGPGVPAPELATGLTAALSALAALALTRLRQRTAALR